VIPTFLSDRNLDGLMIGNAERRKAWRWDRETGSRNRQSREGLAAVGETVEARWLLSRAEERAEASVAATSAEGDST